MKKLVRRGFIIAVLLVAWKTVLGAPNDVEIHSTPQKVDEAAKNSNESMAHSKEHWKYEVTIENKTFKDLAGLEMKYVIFYKPEELGTREEKKCSGRTEALRWMH